MAERKAIFTPPFRVSFPNVFAPSSYNGGEPKYSVVMLFYPKGKDWTKRHTELLEGMKRIADEASLEKFKKRINDLPDNFRKPFRRGEEKSHLEGYGEGMIFATASSKQRPGVVDRDRQDILSEGDFYPGCWARASVTAYAYDNKGKGVAFGLHNLQKLGDGENFTGRLSAEEDFGDDASEVWDGASGANGAVDEDDPLA